MDLDHVEFDINSEGEGLVNASDDSAGESLEGLGSSGLGVIELDLADGHESEAESLGDLAGLEDGIVDGFLDEISLGESDGLGGDVPVDPEENSSAAAGGVDDLGGEFLGGDSDFDGLGHDVTFDFGGGLAIALFVVGGDGEVDGGDGLLVATELSDFSEGVLDLVGVLVKGFGGAGSVAGELDADLDEAGVDGGGGLALDFQSGLDHFFLLLFVILAILVVLVVLLLGLVLHLGHRVALELDFHGVFGLGGNCGDDG